MSKSEDYLDRLLRGVTLEDIEESEPDGDILDEDIFGDILDEASDGALSDVLSGQADGDVSPEDDIFGGDDVFEDEDFLKEFELEMEKLENDSGSLEETGAEEDVLSLFDGLDNILNGTNGQTDSPGEEAERPKPEESPAKAAEPAVEEPVTAAEPEEDVPMSDLFAGDLAGEKAGGDTPAQQEDADVLKILEGLGDVDLGLEGEEAAGADYHSGMQQDFSALEGFLSADSQDGSEFMEYDPESIALVEAALEADKKAKESEKDKKKDKKKASGSDDGKSFLSRLGTILFGEDDDDEEEEKPKKQSLALGNDMMDELNDEDTQLLNELGGAPSSAGDAGKEGKGKKKEKKKKEKKKKEKKEKPKKEKAKKEKKPKPKKEKKPKPPKEPDNTPPLPKKPVILIFVMVGSLLALIVVGADLLGYSNQMENAKNLYEKQNYSEAFAQISGIEVKEEDGELYHKYHTMALVSAEYEAYESLMNAGFYDMALDCLVRTVGRAEKYSEDARLYGCIQEVEAISQAAEEVLSTTFGVSREEALEYYASKTREAYTARLQNALREAGLEMVAE